MKVYGLTGGIGAGKSTVSKIFNLLNVPVFNADETAKAIVNSNTEVKNEIIKTFGKEAFKKNVYNTAFIAGKVFSNPQLLSVLNQIIHPKVAEAFESWKKENREQKILLKEAAILIETGGYKSLDGVIMVTAPKELRIKRVIQRSKLSENEILERMNKQLPDEEKLNHADFVIYNDEKQLLIPQVLKIYKKIISNL
ncbi:MAG: dephospho-CoA kinase [Vicingaceae bacterium]